MKHRRNLIASALLMLIHPLCAQLTPSVSVSGEYMQSSKIEFDDTDQGFTLRKASADIAFTHGYGSASSSMERGSASYSNLPTSIPKNT